MSQLVRMPDQFTPGRGARAAATPTCSSCCCCCCCVVSLITSSVVLPVGAARAVRDHAEVEAPARPPAGRAFGYLLLALTPLVTLGVAVLVGAMLVGFDSGAAVAVVVVLVAGAVGCGLSHAGDRLVGRPRPGVSAALLIMFGGLFTLELFVSVLLLSSSDTAYVVATLVALPVVLGGYLLLPRLSR